MTGSYLPCPHCSADNHVMRTYCIRCRRPLAAPSPAGDDAASPARLRQSGAPPRQAGEEAGAPQRVSGGTRRSLGAAGSSGSHATATPADGGSAPLPAAVGLVSQ
jgi:hypothetical protein